MSQLTQAQVLSYNKKVTVAKEKASQDKARKDLAEKELSRTCEELTDLLGRPVTPENLEAEYAAFVADATKTIESGTKILDGLETEQDEALGRGDTSSVAATQSANVAPTTVKKDEGIDLDDLLGLD